MPEKELDLLKLAARIMAEPRIGSSKIMRRKPWNVHARVSFLDHVPDLSFLKCRIPRVYPPHRHIGIADHFRYRLLVNHASSVSFTPFPNSVRERFVCAFLRQ